MVDDADELHAIASMTAELLSWEEEISGLLAAPEPQPRPASAGRAVSKASSAGHIETPTDLESAERGAAAASARPIERVAPDVEEATPPEARVKTPEERAEDLRLLESLAAEVARCEACGLCKERTQTVFARGSASAELVFVGEGPGYNEDQQGQPFVGAAGQLLDKMIGAMGYRPEDVYICNVVKCRPPDNRTPTPEESAACMPFLTRQLAILQPRAIVALGRCAAEALEVMPESGRGWRGQWARWRGIDVMPTYHPAFLLRTPRFKRAVWDDLQLVMRRLGREPAR